MYIHVETVTGQSVIDYIQIMTTANNIHNIVKLLFFYEYSKIFFNDDFEKWELIHNSDNELETKYFCAVFGGIKNCIWYNFFNSKLLNKHYYFRYCSISNKNTNSKINKKTNYLWSNCSCVILIAMNNTAIKSVSNIYSYFYDIIHLIVYCILQMYLRHSHTFKFAKSYFLWCIEYLVLIHTIYIKYDLILIVIAIENTQNEIISNAYNFYSLLIVLMIQTMNILVKIVCFRYITTSHGNDNHKQVQFFWNSRYTTRMLTYFCFVGQLHKQA